MARDAPLCKVARLSSAGEAASIGAEAKNLVKKCQVMFMFTCTVDQRLIGKY